MIVKADEEFDSETYIHMIDHTPSNFMFLVYYPTQSFTEKGWTSFWNGSSLLYKCNKLGCLIITLPFKFNPSPKNIDRLSKFIGYIPKDVKVAFEIFNKDWIPIIKDRFPEKCIVTSCVENNLIDPRWAGNIGSTRTSGVPNIHSDADPVVLIFYGTFGKGYGSYDKDDFLWKTFQKLKDMALTYPNNTKEIYCIFANSLSSINKPLPTVNIDGVDTEDLTPKTNILEKDEVCSIHDSKIFKKYIDTYI